MYTIGEIVYGVPYTPELEAKIEALLEEKPCLWGDDYGPCSCDHKHDWTIAPEDPQSFGFTTTYSGNSTRLVAYCGPFVTDIDECQNVRVSELLERLVVTDEILAKWQECVENTPPEIRALLPDPEFWIIWATS